MHRNKSTLWVLLWIVLAAALLMGCGTKGKPAEFEQTAGEMKQGPGVFTGEEGEFTVYDSKKGGPFWEHQKEQSGVASQQAGKETQTVAGQTPGETQVTPEEARDFQQFQEWKQEQKEFREFMEWKKSAKGSAEYREFLEWKEWKSYQEWKQQQGQ
jgi:hypothetical protein